MKGQQEVNQVFFDNVRVPVSNRIGEEGKGWTYAKYLLEFERGNAYAPGLKTALAKAKRLAHYEGVDRDPDFARKAAELEIQIAALDATELRIFSSLSAGKSIGAASSMLKCAGSEAQQAISELALEAVGLYAQPFVQDTWAEIQGRSNAPRPGPDYAGPVAPAYFNYRKTSIYAGSNEVQRNIMAKLVLGL
jgi:alkylation response protein AidB-like acyl-CoA dehydrogenase